MAVAEGSGVYVKPRPKPYRPPISPHQNGVPYGYQGVQSPLSIQAVPSGFVPDPRGQTGDEVWAEWARQQLGVTRSFGYGTRSEVGGDVESLMGLVPFGGPAEQGAARGPGFLTKILGSVKSLASGKRPAETLAEQKLVHEAFDTSNTALRRSGFLKSPEDIEKGREATRTVHGQIPAALDIMLKREQESMPFLNRLLEYSNRSKERYAPDVLAARGSEGLVHNPNVPKVGKPGPGTLRPSSGTPEGRMLDEILSQYGDVGGSPLADRPGGLVKPLWERGDTPQGDVISRVKNRPNPDNEVFDFLAGGKPQFEQGGPFGPDLSAEAYGIPKKRMLRGYEGKHIHAGDQGKARGAYPYMAAERFFQTALGSPTVRGPLHMEEGINPELTRLLTYVFNTTKHAGGAGVENSATAYAQNPAEWLARLLQRPAGMQDINRRAYGSSN